MAGEFVIRRSEDEFYFVLKASNGEVVATSERYTTKDGAVNGIEAVRRNAADATIEDESSEPVLA